jgi:hypothetical protein
VSFEGKVEEAISFYLSSQKHAEAIQFPIKMKHSQIVDFKILDHLSNTSSTFMTGQFCKFQIKLKNEDANSIEFNIRFQIFDIKENLISTINAYHQNSTKTIKPNVVEIFNCVMSKYPLTANNYVLGLKIIDFNRKSILYQKDDFFEFNVENGDFFNSGKLPSERNSGKFLIDSQWD